MHDGQTDGWRKKERSIHNANKNILIGFKEEKKTEQWREGRTDRGKSREKVMWVVRRDIR